MDRLKQIETFVAVATKGSLTAAAQAEGVAPAIIGRRMDALEARLGVKLLLRTTRRISLTHEGSAFLEDCQRLIADFNNAEASVSAGGVKASGHLRLTAPAGFGRRHVAPLVPEFLAQHQDLSLSLNLSDRVVDIVNEGFDCAVRVGAVDEPRVVALPLAEVPRIVVAAPSLADAESITTPEQAQALPWISLVTYYRERLLLHDAQGRAHTLAITPRLLSDNLFVVQQAARAGLGAAVVSAYAALDTKEVARTAVEMFSGEKLPARKK